LFDILVSDLHALRRREGMGEPAFPPQGVGMPVCFLEWLETPGLKPSSISALHGAKAPLFRGIAAVDPYAGLHF
jgi:hypothetical protein